MMEYSFDVLVVIRMNPAAEDELLFIPLLSIPLCLVFSSPLHHNSLLQNKLSRVSFQKSKSLHFLPLQSKESKFPLQTKHVGRRYEQGNAPPVDAFSRL